MIQWHEWGDGAQSFDGRFFLESRLAGWQAYCTFGEREASPYFDSIEEAKGWCEMRVQTEQVMPDVLIETIDGQTVILPATEAPEF